MQWVNQAVEAAILAAERNVSVALWVDWDGDGQDGWGSRDDISEMVASFRLDRSLDGELPDQVRLIAGAGVASARVTLAGRDGMSGAAYFSPLNPASPLHGRARVGCAVQLATMWQTSDGPRAVYRLVGSTRTLSVNAARREATLTMLDERERLRGLVALPPIDGTRYGANASWVVSWTLAVCGWTPGPLPRNMRRLGPVADAAWISDAAICLPMHGSLWPWFHGLSHGGGLPPSIGAFSANGGAEVATRPRFERGPFLLGAYADALAVNRYTVIRATLPVSEGARTVFENATRTGRLEMWIRGDAYPASGATSDEAVSVRAAPLPGGNVTFSVGVWRDRSLYARLAAGNTTRFHVLGPELPDDGRWHFVGIAFRLSGTAPQIVMQLDDDPQTFNVVLGGAVALADVFTLTAFLPISDVHLTSTPLSTPWVNDGLDNRIDCDLDPSTLELDAVVERDQREAWGLLREVAAAEQAVTLCDEFGRFAYRTRARPGSTGFDVTLTATNAITDITVTESLDTVRTLVEVPYTAPIIGTGYAWTLDQPVLVPAGRTVTLPVVLDVPAVQLDMGLDLVAATPAAPVSHLRANTNPAGTGTAITTGVAADGEGFTTTGLGRIRFTNSNTQPVYVIDARLAGRVIRTRPSGVAIAEHPRLATTGEQPQPLRLPDSQWVQRHDVAAALAAAILPDVAEPRPVVTDLAIRADPRIQLGDRARLVDRDGIGINGDWWITGISESYDPGSGYTMRLTARQAT